MKQWFSRFSLVITQISRKTNTQKKGIQWTVAVRVQVEKCQEKAIAARISQHKPERLLPLTRRRRKKKPLKTCPVSAAATVGLRRIPDWLKEVRWPPGEVRKIPPLTMGMTVGVSAKPYCVCIGVCVCVCVCIYIYIHLYISINVCFYIFDYKLTTRSHASMLKCRMVFETS